MRSVKHRIKWFLPGLNRGREVLQTSALPTELRNQMSFYGRTLTYSLALGIGLEPI